MIRQLIRFVRSRSKLNVRFFNFFQENVMTQMNQLKAKLRQFLLPEDNEMESVEHRSEWWRVMCLTGVDYFSTLGYQPSIAFVAAGFLSPLATIVLVLVTLLCALPTYSRVAKFSPHGQGSIKMLEGLIPGWWSKSLVLVLISFAAMAFVITITLSAADASAHLIENPIIGDLIGTPVEVTLVLIGILGALFLKGFREVVGVAVVIVGAYLTLNAMLILVLSMKLLFHPELIASWHARVAVEYTSLAEMLVVSILVFPRLALGLSGFETGVMVMPLVKGHEDDTEEEPKGRIENTRKLLRTAALIMSVLLISSSFLTTLFIPEKAMVAGGAADGRALAYLAHEHMGSIFGTLYDFVTVAILWFAGSSALAGLVNLVPRYLPGYGMAPDWARAVRPLVLFFTVVCFLITLVFKANVHAQGAAYATGVLVFLTAASVAVTLALWSRGFLYRIGFGLITLIFTYTTSVNVFTQPDGVKVAFLFLIVILGTSLVSRARRATELRIENVELDEKAAGFVKESIARFGHLRLVAHKHGGSAYAVKKQEMVAKHNLQEEETLIFVEVHVEDSSHFSWPVLEVVGSRKGEGDHPVLKCKGPAIPNAIAALALYLRNEYAVVPHVYFGWTEGSPIVENIRYLIFGDGEIASLTKEVIRGQEEDRKRRPRIHVA